jgi:N-methylhydantoinase A
MEVVNLRLVVGAAREDTFAERWLFEPWTPEGAAEETTRPVVFEDPNQPIETRIVWRPALPAGSRIEGPAVIEEPNSTTLVHPGDVVTVADAGHLMISVGSEG